MLYRGWPAPPITAAGQDRDSHTRIQGIRAHASKGMLSCHELETLQAIQEAHFNAGLAHRYRARLNMRTPTRRLDVIFLAS
jgi:hypothetical protein